MTVHQAEIRLESLFQQLDVINLFEVEFHAKLGRRGTEEYRDMILDEIITLKKFIKDAKRSK
jgi:hypothetical protein